MDILGTAIPPDDVEEHFILPPQSPSSSEEEEEEEEEEQEQEQEQEQEMQNWPIVNKCKLVFAPWLNNCSKGRPY